MKLKELTEAFWHTMLMIIGIYNEQDWYEPTAIIRDSDGLYYLEADKKRTPCLDEASARRLATFNAYRITSVKDLCNTKKCKE